MTKTRVLHCLAPGLNMGQGIVAELEAAQDKKEFSWQ